MSFENVKKIFAFVWVSEQLKGIDAKIVISFEEHGAHVVQLDFTEARLSLKVDP